MSMSKYMYVLGSFIFFLIFLFISSFFFSIDSIHSLYGLFLWSLYGCVLCFSIAIPLRFSQQRFLLLICFFIAAFLFIGHSVNGGMFHFLTTTSDQFILRIMDEHNHLGDFAGLALVLLVLSPHPLIYCVPMILFIVFILAVSFSKSAFLAITVVLFILALRKGGVYRYGFGVVLCLSIVIVAIYTKEFSRVPIIQSGQKIMQETLKLNPKPLFSARNFYYPQVIRAWKSAPLEQLLFGYGLGNYIYPSIKTGNTQDLTPTETHNILLSIFIENGGLALFWFLIFCALIVWWGMRVNNQSVYLFIYLIVNFQTDFTYIIPLFMGAFFFFAGQSIHKDTRRSVDAHPAALYVLYVCVVTLFVIAGISYLSIINRRETLNKQLAAMIVKNQKDTIQNTIKHLELITPYRESELVKWSSIQEAIGNNSEAIRLLEKLSVYSPRWYLLYLPHQLELQKKMGIDNKKYIMNRKNDITQFPYTLLEKEKLNEICIQYVESPCVE